MYKILAINLGSTSTKLAYYEDDNCILTKSLTHPAHEICKFNTIWNQYDYRMAAINTFLAESGLSTNELSAVVTRGGHTQPLNGGVYELSDEMLAQSRSEKYGIHPADLGLQIARGIAGEGVRTFTVDPPTSDEFDPLARYSGLPDMPRRSSFQVLNHRAVGKQFAKDQGLDYKELNLVVANMGGGITVAVHKKGRLVDANNGIMGDGPFSTNRTGTLPVGTLVEYCFSGASKRDVLSRLNGQGGLMAYLGESDVRVVESKAMAGDDICREVLEAMCYQIAKEIGSCATVLCGDVKAILLAGGMANSQFVVDQIRSRVGFIAPLYIYPGEYEMQSLALHTYDALRGVEPIQIFKGRDMS